MEPKAASDLMTNLMDMWKRAQLEVADATANSEAAEDRLWKSRKHRDTLYAAYKAIAGHGPDYDL